MTKPTRCPGPKVIKLFSFQPLIKTKIPTNIEVSCFKSLRCCTYHANKCLNANNCWHFNIYEQDKFRAQLSEDEKCFITSGPAHQEKTLVSFSICPVWLA